MNNADEYLARQNRVAARASAALKRAKRQAEKRRVESVDWLKPDIDEIVSVLKHYSAPEILALEKECTARGQYTLAIMLNAYGTVKFMRK